MRKAAPECALACMRCARWLLVIEQGKGESRRVIDRARVRARSRRGKAWEAAKGATDFSECAAWLNASTIHA